MAGFEHVRRLRRGLAGPGVAMVAVVCAVGPLAGTAAAAPERPQPSVADVQHEIADLGHQLDTATEQYNGAAIRLDEARRASSAADAAEKRADDQVDRQRARVRMLASAAYQAGPLSSVAAMVSSRSPGDFLDRLSMLDALSRRRHQILDGLAAVRSKAAEAARAADRSAADAQQRSADLAAKKAWISRRLPEQMTLLASLTDAQRQQALDPAGRASRAAPRLPVGSAPATGRAAVAVAAAMSKLGSPYVWAAAGPDTFDCSGLMLWAWAQAGVALPHYTGDQYVMGPHPAESELQPGDLVFFYPPDLSHVGMYIGNGNVIHAPEPGDVVKISPLGSFPYAGATRVG